jgi:hypothetical protein
MKDGSGDGVKLVAAELAAITFAVFDSIELSFLGTLGTNFDIAVAGVKDFIKASAIIGVGLVEVVNREFHT